jgi:uncharacterized protein DUF5941
MTDCWYGVARDEELALRPGAPFDQPADPFGRTGSGSGLVATLARAAGPERRTALHWLKKLLVFPIGERWLVIAGCAALFNARVAFVALLAWGGFAAVYTLAVRSLRTRSSRAATLGRRDVALHRDDGAVAALAGKVGESLIGPGEVAALPTAVAAAGVGLALIVAQRTDVGQAMRVVTALALVVLLLLSAVAGRDPHLGRMDWLVPGALRLAELVTLVAIGVGAAVPAPLVFTLLVVVAMFHYDLAARLDKSASPIRFRAAALGWDGRLLVAALAALLGVATMGFAVLATYLAVVFVAGAVVGVRRTGRSQRLPGNRQGTRVPRQTRRVDHTATVD